MIFEDQYKYIQLFDDNYLGKVELWQKHNLLAFGKSFPSNYPHQRLHDRSQWNHPSIVKMLAAELDDNKKIKIYFEYFEDTLESKIAKQKQPFSEQEITAIHQELVQSIQYIQRKGQNITNLLSSGIYLNQDGQIKLVEDLSYEMKIQNQNIGFQLGLILLELGTIDSSKVVYDLSGQVIKNNVNLLLQKMEKNYSNELMELVKGLIDGQITLLTSQHTQRSSLDTLGSSISSSFSYSNRQAIQAILKSREMLMRL